MPADVDPEEPTIAVQASLHGHVVAEGKTEVGPGADNSLMQNPREGDRSSLDDPPRAILSTGTSNATSGYAEVRDSDSSLVVALDLLRQAVLAIMGRGSPTVAAAVSLEMKRISAGVFSHSDLGFAKFRDFLRFADSLGVIAVLDPGGTSDVQVLLVGQRDEAGTPPEVTRAAETLQRRIRHDFWEAFVNWNPTIQRFYDVKDDRVHFISTKDSGLAEELIAKATLRRISPISQGVQLAWMRDFSESLPPGGEREELMATLREDKPMSSFARSMRENRKANSSWRAYMQRKVVAEVAAWLRENKLEVDIYAAPGTPRAEPDTHAAGRRHASQQAGSRTARRRLNAESVSERIDAQVVRERILRAVEVMPLHDLLRLPIPAEYLLWS